MFANLTWGEAPVPQQVDALEADALPDSTLPEVGLHADEVAMARAMPAARRGTFVAGRLALRQALRVHGHDGEWPILRTARGAPSLPDQVTGSIAHKQTLAIAAIAPRSNTMQHVGIDLERRPTEADLRRPSIAPRILLPNEQQRVAALAESTLHQRELELVHFAVKEAVYKAIDPIVQRYVGFLEVELDLELATVDSGSAKTRLHMPEFATTPVALQATWRCADTWIIAAAMFGEP